MLNEMDALRLQVIDSDVKLFDSKISKSRQIALNALQEYLGKFNTEKISETSWWGGGQTAVIN